MSSTIDSTVIDTPVGPLAILAGPDGAVRAAGFTADPASLLPLVHPSLRGEEGRRPALGEPRQRPDLGPITTAVTAYLGGDLAAIDDVPVEQHTAGAFMSHAWQVLREVKPGDPITYTGYAALAGRPAAVRAAAAACARNAAALFVPCHRALRTDGTLGGYRWGLPVKRWLLDHERRA
ncbi:methylated-DNA-[protein]-cysteine S-methyltransferase [Micromonospora phaseoli]|uniref:Methylated-DNA-[protein]-cysteine S-methyltransferase n=1 Tax=Micromonospora phaseoli TaxID=1144548 RepID=A0A1H6X766_9ACTN|nr:methylated-DNA--[protein]-cysteine S-methyltransferase [Micromonospora phaseoli]PZW01950.1 methylated-DNA-[protein]-cysteine S-methyltransferase [Micromonospora phaseoli]GIJ80916.1 putative methylated-DNA:protein-cysteine methyltransferase [Micromonospora phaseoli]SEJ20385.1 methylated-DNA-[protein]-cysteine S-methyltransferase [Micromonospora phaseoli]